MLLSTTTPPATPKPTSIESYQLPQRNAWQGRCLVIIKSSGRMGKMTLRASAEGLPAAEVTVVAE